jgi:hypothetical protein
MSRLPGCVHAHDIEAGNGGRRGGSIDMEGSSSSFLDLLAPLHEILLDENDEIDPEHSELRWGESSSSWTTFSMGDSSGREDQATVTRRFVPHFKGIAYHQDSFYSVTTATSTSSADSMDCPPILPKRRLISFADHVEVREFAVKDNATRDSEDLGDSAVEKDDERISTSSEELRQEFFDFPDTLQRWSRPLVVSEMTELLPPMNVSSYMGPGEDDAETFKGVHLDDS